MYRSRLVRTFLGVSRAKGERHPSAFTGFDAADDMPFERLRDVGRPLHVVNSTLNLVADNRPRCRRAQGDVVYDEPSACRVAATWLSTGGGLRLGNHPRRGVDDVGRCRQLEHGSGCIAGDDVPPDRVQRAPGRLARQSRRFRRRHLEARGAGIRCRAARERAAREDHLHQSLRSSLRRWPLREPWPLRNGASPLPLHRLERCRLRWRLQLWRSGERGEEDPYRFWRRDRFSRRSPLRAARRECAG